MIGELFQRLDRTQEHLLRTIAERTTGSPAPTAPSTPGTVTSHPGSPQENAILAEILAKLGTSDSGMGDRLRSLEDRLGEMMTTLEKAGPSRHSDTNLEPVVDRLDAIERRLRTVVELDSGGSNNWSAVTDEIQSLAEKIGSMGMSMSVGGEGGGTVSLAPISDRLEAIEERLGGDAGAMTLGAALARLSESIERIENRVGEVGGGDGSGGSMDPQWMKSIEETLGSIANRGDDDSAIKAISTLKRDFSLLVHTINGHLQESRQRSEKVENALEVIVSSLVPIARVAGVELETPPVLEKTPEREKETDLA